MKIVITGANGYIGARLSQFLSETGHKVTAVCYPDIPKQNGWTDLIHQTVIGDIRNPDTIEMISEINADAIIHLVSLDHFDSERDPNEVSAINVQPTWNLLERCTQKGLKKFIYFSTIHVYGKNINDFIKETHPPAPFNAYGLTHYLSEEICNLYKRKTETECVNIRLSNSYGEPVFYNANCWSLIINDLTRSAFINKKIILKSDGKAVRDFIHFSDICQGVNTILSKPVGLGNTIHFSSSNSVSMLDVAIAVRSVYFNRYKEIIPIYIKGNEFWNEGKGIDKKTCQIISNERAKSFGISFKKSLKDGIEDLFIYLDENYA